MLQEAPWPYLVPFCLLGALNREDAGGSRERG
jgi:hypothetical protein